MGIPGDYEYDLNVPQTVFSNWYRRVIEPNTSWPRAYPCFIKHIGKEPGLHTHRLESQQAASIWREEMLAELGLTGY